VEANSGPMPGSHLFSRWSKKFSLVARGDVSEGIRFFPFAGDLRDKLVCGDPLGKSDAERLPHRLAYSFRNLAWRLFRVSLRSA
jgi:hypothetical protein